MAISYKTTSPYKDTPVTNKYINYLDMWVSKNIPASLNDQLITISPKYDKRPDLLSYDLYGSVRLWWVFAVRNKDILIDPLEDFVSGKEIYAPSKDTVEGLI